MGDRVLKKIAEYLKAHRWKKNWQAVLTSLAAVVVFCTTYALILPAITLEKANVGIVTQSDADRKTEVKKATPANAVKSTTVSGNDPEEDGDLIFDLDYDLGTRRSLTRGVRSLGIDVDMGVPEWMLSDWDDVPSFNGELTGNWAQDLLAVAESQVGYIADYEGKSYYGDWYGKPYDDWDAMFVSYCLDIAEVPEDVIPRETSAAELAENLVNMDTARFVEAEYHTPEAGELIFFDTDGDGEADRVGIVAEYNARTGELKVIEGDYRTEVERYETKEELASPSNAKKATPSDAKKGKPGRGGGIGSTATPSDAGKVSQKTSPLGSTIGKKETILLTEAVEKADEDETEDADEIASYDIISEAAIVSYDLEELLSGEENVSVVGYAETVMLLTSVSNQDIEDYADDNENRDLEVNVLDSDKSPIEADNDGKYYLNKGESYNIQLTFTSTIGMASGIYYYDFPDGLTLTDETGMLTMPDDSGDSITVGSWELLSNENGGGTITFTVADVILDYTTIDLTVSVTGTVAEGITEITIGEILYTIVDPKENKTLTLDKVFRSADVDGREIKWLIKIVGGKNQGLAGAEITDTISDITNHWYTEDDISAMYLTITDDNGVEHELTLATSYVTWENNYWIYTLPDEFYCEDCGKTIILPSSSEGSAGWTIRLYYSSTIQDGLTGDTILGNQVEAFSLKVYEEASINQSDMEGSITKTGTWHGSSTDGNGNENNIDDAYISWSMEAEIPGVEQDEKYPYSWQIYDTTKIDGTENIAINNLGLDSSDIEVTATFTDGTTVELQNVDDIGAGDSDTMAWDLSSNDSYSSDRTLRLWSRCSCAEDTCGNWNDSDSECATKKSNGFCRCWCIDEDVTITITYKTSAAYQLSDSGEKQNLIDTYAGHFLRNRAALQYQYLPDGSNSYTAYNVDHSDADVTIPGMLTKKLTDEAGSSNGQIAQYEVTLNEAKVDLRDLSEIEIVDTMTYNLVFMPYSMTITAMNAAGNEHEVTDYTVEYEPYDESASDPTTIESNGKEVGANVATIKMNQSELGPYMYTITYTAAFYLPAGKSDTVYSNQVVVEMYGKKYSSELISEEVASVSVTGETYSITITKEDASNNTPLEGAVFGVFTENGTKMAEVTTDENGQVTVETDSGRGILFHEHTIYYLQEIEAPDGYALDDSKHYFWFCNEVDSSDCSSCSAINGQLGEGVSVSVYKNAQSTPGTITITNEPGRKLPESGGTGTLPYTMAGILLTSCACLMYKETRRRRGREEV